MIPRLVIGFTAVVLALAVQPMFGAAVVAPAHPVQAAPIVFQTDMYGGEQVPAVKTAAWGFVRFFFNETKTEADYTVDVKGLSGTLISGADIHRAPRGVNGPVIHHLADGGFIVTSGRMRFTPADMNDIAAGNWYVSLKTVEFPNGELRGQIVLPEGFWTPTNVAPPVVNVLPEPAPVVFAELPAAQVPLDGQALAFPSAACFGELSSVTFSWQPHSGAYEQWLDLSYYDNGFEDGTFYGYGPLQSTDAVLIWDAVPSGYAFYWRVNALTPLGWTPSATGFYTPC